MRDLKLGELDNILGREEAKLEFFAVRINVRRLNITAQKSHKRTSLWGVYAGLPLSWLAPSPVLYHQPGVKLTAKH